MMTINHVPYLFKKNVCVYLNITHMHTTHFCFMLFKFYRIISEIIDGIFCSGIYCGAVPS